MLVAKRVKPKEEAEIRATIRSGLEGGKAKPRKLNPGSTGARGKSTTERLARLGETDTDNAERFVARWGHKVLFTNERGWLIYDGTRYKKASNVECIELAKRTARAIAKEVRFIKDENKRAARARFANQSLSKAALERMIELARGRLLVGHDKFDANPMLFNTLAGTIDLRTGDLYPHDHRDLLTKIAHVDYDKDAKCPMFRAMMKRALGGDVELFRYIQRCVGYTLTAKTTEQVFFFLHGPTGSSKSTFVNVIRDLMGDYGMHTPVETLLVKQYDNAIPNDLAR